MKATYQFCNIRSLFFCCSLVACRVQKEQENLPLIYFSKGKSQKEQKGELEKVSCWLAGFFQVLISVHSVPHLGTVSKKKLIFKKSFYSNYMYYRSNNTKVMIEKKISSCLDFLAEWKCKLDFFLIRLAPPWKYSSELFVATPHEFRLQFRVL